MAIRTTALLGASWGVGHTASLLGVGMVLVIARQALPSSAITLFEAIVALMIVTMGVRAIRVGLRMGAEGPLVTHDHGAAMHTHASAAEHIHIGSLTMARRPLLVGVIHGLAGTGALTTLAVAALPSWPAQVAFMLVFALGSTAGMAVVAGLAGWQLTRFVRTQAAIATLSVATGCVAVIFGLAWAYPLFAN